MPDNAEIARLTIEELNSKGKLEIVDQYYDPSYRGHETLAGELGREELKKATQMYRAAFPDLSLKVDEVAAAGDKVLVRWTCGGTHKGTFLGAAPTGKVATTRGLTVYTFRNGKIVEEWTQWDVLGVVRDLGIMREAQEQLLARQPSP